MAGSRAPASPGPDPSGLQRRRGAQRAMERLRASGEEETVRRRHAIHFLNYVTRAESHLVGGDQLAWFERLELEQGNVRNALDWAFKLDGDLGMLAVRSAAALWRYWLRRRSLSEGITWLERALARPGTDDYLRAQILLALAHLRVVEVRAVREVEHLSHLLISPRAGAGVTRAVLERLPDRREDRLRGCRVDRELPGRPVDEGGARALRLGIERCCARQRVEQAFACLLCKSGNRGQRQRTGTAKRGQIPQNACPIPT